MVYVEKGGEIIPKITGVDKDARSMLIGEKVKFITHCPECGSKLIRFEGEAAHYCPSIIYALCREARFTMVPDSCTGSRLATGVTAPVRPTW